MSFSLDGFAIYILILLRIFCFLAATPFFSLRGIPGFLKTGLCLLLAYILYIAVPYELSADESLIRFGILAAKEVLFGLALGYVVNLIFIGIQIAGQMMDFQIGFSMAAVFDPMTGSRVSLFGNLYYWIGIALFYGLSGHHYLIYGISQSFELVPLTEFGLKQLDIWKIVELFSGTFLIAFEIALPIIVIVLLVDVVMGVLSKSVPQINLLMLNLPLKMLVGILAAIVLLPVIIQSIVRVIEILPYRLNDFMQDIPLAMAFAAGEKTEEATPKRKADARKKGQVAKSTDLSSAVTLILLIIMGHMVSQHVFSALHRYLRHSLENGLSRTVTLGNMISIFLQDSLIFLQVVLPAMAGVMVIGVLANLMQTGFIRSADPLKPDLKRLNPIEGFKNIFSRKALLDLVKNFLKLILASYISWSYIRDNHRDILYAAHRSIHGVFPLVKDFILGLMTRVGISLFILAVLDYMVQRYNFLKNLRMTREEVKEEIKEMEGDPQLRSLRRQKQRQLAMSRMISQVPDSTVVVTNPTHFAVALKYDESTHDAPVVLAKGADYLAGKIRRIAEEEKIPVIENKLLARALYQKGQVGQEIPLELYQAVAEVLAIVYRMEGRTV